MPVPPHCQSAQPHAAALLRALLALSLGWLLVPALAAVSSDGTQNSVQMEAELRVGEQPSAPVAEVGTSEASMRALNARIRSGAQHVQPSSASPGALLLPLRLRALAQPAAIVLAPNSARRVERWRWPLPRSTCAAEDDPSATRSASAR